MTSEQLYDVLHRFGYGESPQSASRASRPACWRRRDLGRHRQADRFPTAMGLSATPLQLAQAYAALGNGGRLMPPTFVKGERSEARQVLDPDDRARRA